MPSQQCGVLTRVAVLVYHSRDKITASDTAHVRLQLENLPFGQACLAHYRIAEGYGDPYAIWEAAGGPPEPTAALYAAMRDTQELAVAAPPQPVTVTGGVCDA